MKFRKVFLRFASMGVIGDSDGSSSSRAVAWEALWLGPLGNRNCISVVSWCRQLFKEGSLLMVSFMKGIWAQERPSKDGDLEESL